MRATLVPAALPVLLAAGFATAQGAAQDDPKSAEAQLKKEIAALAERLYDEKTWPSAARRLRGIGKPSVAPLLAAIGADDQVKDTPRNRRILGLLGEMGPDALGAYEKLGDAAGNCEPEIFVPLWRTLADLAPYSEDQGDVQAAQRMIQAGIQNFQKMRSRDRQTWSREYTRMMSRLQVDPDAGIPAMIAELQRFQSGRREVAAEVLGRMGPKAMEALPPLHAALDRALHPGAERNRQKKAGAAPPGMLVLNAANANLKDDFEARAARAMVAIAPGHKQCAIAYGYLLVHAATAEERAQAALRLGSFGAASTGEVPHLVQACDDAEVRVRWEAITALGMIGPAAQAAAHKLEALSGSEDKAIAARAKAALRQIRPADAKK